MVAAVRSGGSQRAVAAEFGVALATVQLWLKRALDRPLDKVDWSDRPPIAGHVRRTPSDLEDRILDIRRTLREESVLGEYGPAAIRRELEAMVDLPGPPPTIRTIARVLERRGALDAKRRSAGRLHQLAGICPTLAVGWSSWTASTSSTDSGSGAASSSTS